MSEADWTHIETILGGIGAFIFWMGVLWWLFVKSSGPDLSDIPTEFHVYHHYNEYEDEQP